MIQTLARSIYEKTHKDQTNYDPDFGSPFPFCPFGDRFSRAVD